MSKLEIDLDNIIKLDYFEVNSQGGIHLGLKYAGMKVRVIVERIEEKDEIVVPVNVEINKHNMD